MSARDELAEIIWDEDACDWRQSGPNDVAAAILAAGYSKPRTITTAEELDAQADWTIVEANGVCFVNSREGDVCWEGMSAGFASSGKHLIRTHGSVTVLYEPSA